MKGRRGPGPGRLPSPLPGEDEGHVETRAETHWCLFRSIYSWLGPRARICQSRQACAPTERCVEHDWPRFCLT